MRRCFTNTNFRSRSHHTSSIPRGSVNSGRDSLSLRPGLGAAIHPKEHRPGGRAPHLCPSAQLRSQGCPGKQEDHCLGLGVGVGESSGPPFDWIHGPGVSVHGLVIQVYLATQEFCKRQMQGSPSPSSPLNGGDVSGSCRNTPIPHGAGCIEGSVLPSHAQP